MIVTTNIKPDPIYRNKILFEGSEAECKEFIAVIQKLRYMLAIKDCNIMIQDPFNGSAITWICIRNEDILVIKDN